MSDTKERLTASSALSTVSVTSAILEYRKMHGRTYHNFQQVEYW